MKTFGNLANQGLVIQPDRSIVIKNDGTMEASVKFEIDTSNEGLLPAIFAVHPDDTRLKCFETKLTRTKLHKSIVECQYFGINTDPTTKIIQFPGASGQDPIETHPNFKDFAGDKNEPLNGATFEESTGEFLGFFDPENKKFGVKSYIVPNIVVYLSYWTYKKPKIKRQGTIENNIEGILTPPSVKNWLLIGMPYRQVGELYQVTEQFMASGEKGWDEDIYK